MTTIPGADLPAYIRGQIDMGVSLLPIIPSRYRGAVERSLIAMHVAKECADAGDTQKARAYLWGGLLESLLPALMDVESGGRGTAEMMQ